MYESKIFGTTSGGWVIREPPSMTNRARYAFLIEKGAQRSILERGKDHWRYMKKFDTSLLPPSQTRNSFLISIRGVGVQQSKTLQGAIEGLGLAIQDAKEAVSIIVEAVDSAH